MMKFVRENQQVQCSLMFEMMKKSTLNILSLKAIPSCENRFKKSRNLKFFWTVYSVSSYIIGHNYHGLYCHGQVFTDIIIHIIIQITVFESLPPITSYTVILRQLLTYLRSLMPEKSAMKLTTIFSDFVIHGH